MQHLPPHQYKLLKALAEGHQDTSVENLTKTTGLDQALVSAAATELAEVGILEIIEEPKTELLLTDLGSLIGAGQAVLPERQIIEALERYNRDASIKDLSEDEQLKSTGIVPGKFAKSIAELDWAVFEKGRLKFAEGNSPNPSQCSIEQAIGIVHQHNGKLVLEEDPRPVLTEGLEKLRNRKELISIKERKRRFISLTDAGKKLAEAINRGEVHELREANELTAEMLSDGSWRDVKFRPYDVTLAAEQAIPGKTHPLSRVIEQARLAFLELGFSEANCPMAESAFWDFDALFQPQDHPAREMQDTFYMKQPGKYELPDAGTVERVKRTHEDGGETGSRGWRYQWSPERAMQVVLRTHMTASSIRAIARNPHAPQKVFSIGRVFRRETVDYKHLPEFYQVDGIIIDEHATFASLLGTLETFLNRLGIYEVRFKPDFFPYTEPSAGVEAKLGDRWLELAGSGIFRPEVTEPFGCTAPVLAWGFGLERIAMARHGISSIKNLYQSDLDWLKSVPLEG